MSHTDDDTEVALAIRDLLVTNKVTLQLDDVLYGNHNLIPRASAAIVTAGGKTRQLAGVSAPGGRTENNLLIAVQLHWSRVGDEETERIAADERGTALERLIHTDTTIGGLVIHGYITQVDRGDSIINNSMFRSVIMQFVGITRTYLSPPAAPS